MDRIYTEQNRITTTEDMSSNGSDSDNEEYLKATRMVYDPNSSARIICIELENNQNIYVNYKENWTIKDLILSIIKRHEYHLLNPNRHNILSFENHPQLFDLSLCFYDTIKNPHENRMDETISVDKLHEIRLLKITEHHFLFLKAIIPHFHIYIPKNLTPRCLKKLKIRDLTNMLCI